MIVENTRKVSKNLGWKEESLDKKPEHRVKVLMPEVIQVSSLILQYLSFKMFFFSRANERLKLSYSLIEIGQRQLFGIYSYITFDVIIVN